MSCRAQQLLSMPAMLSGLAGVVLARELFVQMAKCFHLAHQCVASLDILHVMLPPRTDAERHRACVQ